ncbi:unnamed protein product [Ectocarpus sp. 8 AP-2014]
MLFSTAAVDCIYSHHYHEREVPFCACFFSLRRVETVRRGGDPAFKATINVDVETVPRALEIRTRTTFVGVPVHLEVFVFVSVFGNDLCVALGAWHRLFNNTLEALFYIVVGFDSGAAVAWCRRGVGFASCVVCVCVSLLDSSIVVHCSLGIPLDRVHARVLQRAYDRPNKSLAVLGTTDPSFDFVLLPNGENSAVFRVFARACISSDSLGRDIVLESERYFQGLLYSKGSFNRDGLMNCLRCGGKKSSPQGEGILRRIGRRRG